MISTTKVQEELCISKISVECLIDSDRPWTCKRGPREVYMALHEDHNMTRSGSGLAKGRKIDWISEGGGKMHLWTIRVRVLGHKLGGIGDG